MKGSKGFWSERPRKGGDDAQLLLAERIHALRHEPYDALRRRADGGAEVEQVDGPSGERFRRRTSVKRFTRGGEEQLRIHVQVDKGTLRGRLDPLAEEMVLATPDGEMVGEYTMASEGNDPRRYRFR